MTYGREYTPDFHMFMNDYMRNAREQGMREYENRINQSVQQATQPPVVTGGTQSYNQPQSSNNAIRADVSSEKQAIDYPINKNGTDMFLVDEVNGIIYLKGLNIGTGQWSVDVYEKRISTNVELPLVEISEKPNPVLEGISALREEISALREIVDSLPREITVTSSAKKTTAPKAPKNGPKSLSQVVEELES